MQIWNSNDKNNMPKVLHSNIVYFLRYTHSYLWNVCLQTYTNNRISLKLAYFLKKIQTSRVHNSSIVRFNYAKFSKALFLCEPERETKKAKGQKQLICSAKVIEVPEAPENLYW